MPKSLRRAIEDLRDEYEGRALDLHGPLGAVEANVFTTVADDLEAILRARDDTSALIRMIRSFSAKLAGLEQHYNTTLTDLYAQLEAKQERIRELEKRVLATALNEAADKLEAGA